MSWKFGVKQTVTFDDSAITGTNYPTPSQLQDKDYLCKSTFNDQQKPSSPTESFELTSNDKSSRRNKHVLSKLADLWAPYIDDSKTIDENLGALTRYLSEESVREKFKRKLVRRRTAMNSNSPRSDLETNISALDRSSSDWMSHQALGPSLLSSLYPEDGKLYNSHVSDSIGFSFIPPAHLREPGINITPIDELLAIQDQNDHHYSNYSNTCKSRNSSTTEQRFGRFIERGKNERERTLESMSERLAHLENENKRLRQTTRTLVEEANQPHDQIALQELICDSLRDKFKQESRRLLSQVSYNSDDEEDSVSVCSLPNSCAPSVTDTDVSLVEEERPLVLLSNTGRCLVEATSGRSRKTCSVAMPTPGEIASKPTSTGVSYLKFPLNRILPLVKRNHKDARRCTANKSRQEDLYRPQYDDAVGHGSSRNESPRVTATLNRHSPTCSIPKSYQAPQNHNHSDKDDLITTDKESTYVTIDGVNKQLKEMNERASSRIEGLEQRMRELQQAQAEVLNMDVPKPSILKDEESEEKHNLYSCV